MKDLALVEDVWLELGPGLTVFTGETGAGKTVLVSALKLLLGERADSALVREGAAEALVEGTFAIDGREVMIRRRLTSEGRSRCTIDGEMATVTMLADLLGPRVDLHGQHEHQSLLSPARHAGYLDRFIGEAATRAKLAYREAWERRSSAQQHLEGVKAALADVSRKSDHLSFQVSEIDAVAPSVGEDDDLEARLPRLRHGERLAEAASAARAALRDEGGASDALSQALGALGTARGLDPALDGLGDALGALDVEMGEVAAALRSYVEGVDHDPSVLDQTERRLQQLRDLKRKYGPSLDAVMSVRDNAARDLALLGDGEAGLERATAEREQAAAELRAAGDRLSATREEGAGTFAERLAAAAADLALAHAVFEVSRTLLDFEAWTAEGPERVEFLFASGAGESPRPLAKVASGGEVSRVMLALKGVLGAADSVPVLVFDEIDAGIGGATALAVGRRLATLASGHQVLAVTHLPQVAAHADAHVVVEKSSSGSRTVTTAHHIEGDDLVSEIARMLSGDVSSTALTHARELLAGAGMDLKG